MVLPASIRALTNWLVALETLHDLYGAPKISLPAHEALKAGVLGAYAGALMEKPYRGKSVSEWVFLRVVVETFKKKKNRKKKEERRMEGVTHCMCKSSWCHNWRPSWSRPRKWWQPFLEPLGASGQ